MASHPSESRILRFSRGRLDPNESQEIYEHLLECRDCFSRYVEEAGSRSAWLGGRARRRRRRRVGTLALAVVGLGILLLPVLGPDEAGPALGIPPAVVDAVGETSSEGFVLPGGERFHGRPAPVYRRGGTTAPGLQAALRQVLGEYEGSPKSADLASWATAGLVAAGRIEDARVFAEEAVERFPDDPRFPVLRAAVAYRENRMEDAERLLRDALGRNPSDLLTGVDLTFVLLEQGKTADAHVLILSLERRHTRGLFERCVAGLLPPKPASR